MTDLQTGAATDPSIGASGSPEALAAALAQVRRELAHDGVAAVARLKSLAESGLHLLDAPQGASELPAGWLSLLDELNLLMETVEGQRDALAEQARSVARHRRAGTAYHGGTARS